MIIAGLQRSSLIDYPAELSAVIFTQGCSFRCVYCHNPELVNPKLFGKPLTEEEIFNFLEKRKKQLDAVVITGGEPTIHNDLPDFIRKIKKMGYKVKLDTNGSNPEMLELLIKEKLVDYIAMDIKAPLELKSQISNLKSQNHRAKSKIKNKHEKIADVKVDLEKIRKSVKLIIDSNIKYEFRTTVVKSLLSFDDVLEIAKDINGAELYFIQKFIPSKTLKRGMMKEKTYENEEFEELKQKAESYVKKCLVR